MTSENGLRASGIRITLPTLGAISSIIGVFIFVSGWVIGYLTFRADMRTISEGVVSLKTEIASLQTRNNIMSQTITDDRQTLSNRLTAIEIDSKYISQGIAELKIAIVPKR
jgi:hypothetical protein